MFNLGMGEITVILLLALIFLGPAKLPDLAAGLGKLIKEVRKATSDVKNEIALDDSFRKPFEELRDAVTLHPDELKRRDEWRKTQEEMAKRAAEEAALAPPVPPAEGEPAAAAGEPPEGPPLPPPDGLFSPVTTQGVSHPNVADLASAAPTVVPEQTSGPNDTIIQAVTRGASLEDIPTPPPEPTAAKPPARKPTPPVGVPARKPTPPLGAVARKPTPPALPIAAAKAFAPEPAPAPLNGGSGNPNNTQILSEEDLMPSTSSGRPPPPPHLPGLRPAGAPRPGIMPPLPPNPLEKKKP